MSTFEIAEEVIKYVQEDKYDFIMVNFASPDMVGHTGDLAAGIKAVEFVDKAVGQIIDAILAKHGTIIITADHGNVEEMINLETKEIDTEHSKNPVPLIIVSHDNFKLVTNGQLANIAPTILDILGISKPKLMTDKSLIV
jgi:2,3-bisphosphoglycerate-independent phosphoglycerate mutase